MESLKTSKEGEQESEGVPTGFAKAIPVAVGFPFLKSE